MATDETIYVAVGEGEESVLTLLWALHNLSPLKVCILHVLQPTRRSDVQIMFGQELFRLLEEAGNDHMMHRKMDEYLILCREAGVSAEKLSIQRDDVAEGIVELICRHKIKKLVMGAAAEDNFSEGMLLASEKAHYVNEIAPVSCQIWFICGERLVHTRLETGQSSNAPSPAGSSYLTSSSEAAGMLDTTVFEEREESECELELLHATHDRDSSSRPNDGSSNDQLYDQLEQALQEVEISNRKAFEESERRVKAEKMAVQAKREAKAFERMYIECKRESETALAKQRGELDRMKRQRDEESSSTVEQKYILESQVASSNHKMRELEDKLSSSEKERQWLQVELENTCKINEVLLRKQEGETSSTSETHDAILDQLKVCQREKDESQFELENTRKMIELLRKQAEDTSNPHLQQPLTEFSLSEIQEATEDFHPRFEIANGNRGSVYYKCLLRHTEVAIKVPDENSLQDPSQFQQEVEDLSKSRHPNLVTLIGTCPDICALIYEYLPNGSLEDRLNCKDDNPPLPWQTRIHIATQLCNTLMFLHSNKPQSVVHGNLKPGNILLDANFCCKLSDFGASRALSLVANTSNTYPYLDPDFRYTRSLSKCLDLYPFGIILLQLLSGRSTQGIAGSAQNAVRNGGNPNSFLDSSAGNWPYQVTSLIHLAIRCCDINPSRRPDLASDVLEALQKMKTTSEASSSLLSESDEDNREPPSYFICPITKEVMRDPHFAADGHTYEITALQEWLADRNTSPMTNLRLEHQRLVPNHALRSSIQEWQQRR